MKFMHAFGYNLSHYPLNTLKAISVTSIAFIVIVMLAEDVMSSILYMLSCIF